MNRDEIIAVPTLMLMVKSEDMPEFMNNHPFLLPPPKRRDVNLRSRPFLVSDQARIISIRQIAREQNVFRLVRPRYETDLRTSIRPSLHATLDYGLLFRR